MRHPLFHFRQVRSWILLSALAACSLLTNTAKAQDASFAKRVSGTDLLGYVEYNGLDANAKEWKASAAYKALNETTLGLLLEDLTAQGLDLAMKGKIPNPPPGPQVVKTLELIAKKGFALGLNGKPPGEPSFTLIVRGGTSSEFMGMLKKLGLPAGTTAKQGTRNVTTYGAGPGALVAIEDKTDLVITNPASSAKVIALLEGKGTNASTNANYVELAKPEGTFKPMGLAFVDPKVLGDLPPPVAALGLDGLKRIDLRWGTNETALQTVLRLVAPSPRKGVLALLDGASYDKASLPPLPAGATGFMTMSISPQSLYDKIVAIYKLTNPQVGDQIDMLQQVVDQQLNASLKKDLLGKLGPKWSVFAAPADGLPMNFAAVVDVTDPTRFATTLDSVMNIVNMQLQAAGGPNAAKGPVPQFKKLEGKQLGYELILPPGMVQAGPMAALKITLLIGKKYLVIASTGKTAANVLNMADNNTGRWKPDAVFTKALETVPKGLVFLSVSDPRQTFPQLLTTLPVLLASANMALAQQGGPNGGGQGIPIKIDQAKIPKPADLSAKLFPAYQAVIADAKGISFISHESLPGFGGNPAVPAIGVALLLPAVQAAREAARRTQCVNNLKQIGLAMHNFHSTTDAFPGDIVSKQGKPLLSWRVAILPYLEQQDLYNKFKLDEPWDSPNNKPLLAQMPATFACPSLPASPGMTHYQGWGGPGTFFADAKKPTQIRQILDGTSNTIAVAETKGETPWTKPDSPAVDPKLPMFGAGSLHPGGFNALLADGSVRFIKLTIDPVTLKALITINGGEVINPAGF